MAVPWPSQLQQKFNVDSFQIAFGDTTVRSDMDVGLDKVRSRYTDGVDLYSSTINMDIDDYGILMTFYKTTIGNGTQPFEFLNPMNNTVEEFRFAEPPSMTPLGGRVFRVSLKWERMP